MEVETIGKDRYHKYLDYTYTGNKPLQILSSGGDFSVIFSKQETHRQWQLKLHK